MKIKICMLADYSNIDAAGKLNILGIFGQINARQFPYTHDSMHALIILDMEEERLSGNKELKLRIVSEAGEEVREIRANHEFPAQQSEEHKAATFVFSLRDLEFPQPGKYEFNLYIENQRIPGQQIVLLLHLESGA